MAAFKLVIQPDGKALLTTDQRLSEAMFHQVQQAIKGWSDGQWPVLVVTDCEVVQVFDIDVDLTLPVEGVV